METERPRIFLARWAALLLLAVCWLTVGIRYLLDTEDDPRMTLVFMICCVVGLPAWGRIWLKKRWKSKMLKGNTNLMFLDHLARLTLWATIGFFIVATISYLFHKIV